MASEAIKAFQTYGGLRGEVGFDPGPGVDPITPYPLDLSLPSVGMALSGRGEVR